MNILDIWKEFWAGYRAALDKYNLSYVITSGNRPKDPEGSPHKIPGNALDITLRTDGSYAVIKEYHELFCFLIENWPYRAGIDNTPQDGNVHIHLDLGQTNKTLMPFFFIENNGRFLKQVKTAEEYLS